MENIKQRITYIRKCFNCANKSTYIFRFENVNPMSDESALAGIRNY